MAKAHASRLKPADGLIGGANHHLKVVASNSQRLSAIQRHSHRALTLIILGASIIGAIRGADDCPNAPKPATTAPAAPAVAAAPVIDRDFKIETQPQGFSEKFTFDARRLFNHADYLASDECNGRLASSPGEALAREYIVKHLTDSGYKEIRQFPFEFIADVKLEGENFLTARYQNTDLNVDNYYRKPELVRTAPSGAGRALDALYKLDEDYRPMRISKSDFVNPSQSSLVFAGYGISAPDKNYDDYKDLDVKGKVVLVIRTEPETSDGKRIGIPAANPHASLSVYSDLFYKAGIARDKGAAALVIVNGKRGMSNAERESLETFAHGSGKTDCGIPLIQVMPEVADDWLRPSKKDIASLQAEIDKDLTPHSFAVDGVSIGLNVNIKREHATDRNVVVVLPGNDPALRNEIVVIGAHYDHLGRGNEFSLAGKSGMGQIHRGADDNASGVSSVLELADALHKNRAALKRTVWIMFFGAEELGTLGSNDFVKNPPADFQIKNVAAMLNLDMVGRCRQNKLMVYGAGTGTGFDKVLEAANAQTKLDLKPTQDGFGGSDQTAFVSAGVPVLFFFTGSHEDYHKPSDTADKLAVDQQARITAFALNVAAETINAPERPKFVKLEAPKMSGGIGGVGLGTLPDYAYEGKGLRINDVREKSAADKAGLKGGDVIVELSGRKIENIYDYMNALKQCQAGIETTAKILRDGKEIEFKVTPEKR